MMKIAVLGTGTVGRTIAEKLDSLGHEVVMGTREPAETMAREGRDGMGNPPFGEWHEAHGSVSLATFAEAAEQAEVIFNCTSGAGSVEALTLAGAERLDGKLLLDVSNPLDFSRGFPPTLSVCNDDSLGEQIQRAFPRLRVVKTLNTVTARLMVEPGLVPGDHVVFVSGNDPDAKAEVAEYLRTWFGWRSVVDLGDITTARGVEMYLPLWVRLYGVEQQPLFNITIVRGNSS